MNKLKYERIKTFSGEDVTIVFDVSIEQKDLLNLADMVGMSMTYNLRRRHVGYRGGRMWGLTELVDRFMESAQLLGYEFEEGELEDEY